MKYVSMLGQGKLDGRHLPGMFAAWWAWAFPVNDGRLFTPPPERKMGCEVLRMTAFAAE
jgi:hypothetical protein